MSLTAIPAGLPCCYFCSYVNKGNCLPSIVGKPVVGGGCQKKIEGCVSNAKPNIISKTKLKILPLNLPRQSHKEAGQGHLES